MFKNWRRVVLSLRVGSLKQSAKKKAMKELLKCLREMMRCLTVNYSKDKMKNVKMNMLILNGN